MDTQIERYKAVRRLPRLLRDVAALKKAVSRPAKATKSAARRGMVGHQLMSVTEKVIDIIAEQAMCSNPRM